MGPKKKGFASFGGFDSFGMEITKIDDVQCLTKMEPAPQSELLDAISGLLENGKYSDFTIFCGERTFNVHRCIISPRSGFFAAACDKNFKEAKERAIHLDDDDPIVVENLLRYLYKLDYDDGSSSRTSHSRVLDAKTARPTEEPVASTRDSDVKVLIASFQSSVVADSLPAATPVTTADPPPLMNARVYAIAEKYEVLGLKALSKKKFQETLRDKWNNESFATTIRSVYNSTPEQDRSLRQVVVEVALKHISVLKEREDFKLLLQELHEFTADLFLESLKHTSGSCQQCGSALDYGWTSDFVFGS